MTAVHVVTTPTEEREADAEGGAPIELTVAFTDLEDFTTYTEAEGDNAASRLLIGHHRESEPIVRSRGGRVLKRLGDGLMLTFPEPEAAVLACLDLREAAPLRLRAGIHGGKVLVAGDDVIGHVVNLAARVTASAAGGELVVTLCVSGRDGGGLDAVAVVDGQGVQDGLPGVDPPGRVRSVRPLLGGNEVEDLERRLFVGEVSAVADGFADRALKFKCARPRRHRPAGGRLLSRGSVGNGRVRRRDPPTQRTDHPGVSHLPR